MSPLPVCVLGLLLLVSVPDPGWCEAEPGGLVEPYDQLFDTAVEAYYRQDWLSVILNMERALRNKGTVRTVKAQCRSSCANITSFQHPEPGWPVPLPGAGPVQDLGFFQRVLQRAECVSQCEAQKLGAPSLHKISDEVELEFSKRTPYNYLQVAYFKVKPHACVSYWSFTLHGHICPMEQEHHTGPTALREHQQVMLFD